MSTDLLTIDHNTLSRLVEAGAVRGAHVISQIGGWCVIIKYGMLERPLAATRSKKVRKFKKLETLVNYLKEIGISRFDIDATDYDQSSIQTYKRPDRVEAIRKNQEAIEQGDKIAKNIVKLIAFPKLGRAGRVKSTRELVISGTSFIVIYKISGDKIKILALLHGSQQWPKN